MTSKLRPSPSWIAAAALSIAAGPQPFLRLRVALDERLQRATVPVLQLIEIGPRSGAPRPRLSGRIQTDRRPACEPKKPLPLSPVKGQYRVCVDAVVSAHAYEATAADELRASAGARSEPVALLHP